ncbi:hypothetical protein FRC03_010678 [Tulasnella sp. 419]|nr:hypothetical protein FRC03_010678 [Tulasnella sp. 419]
MLELLQKVEGMSILELGVGSGYLAKCLADSGACVTGIDGSSEMVSIARDRLGPGADLHVHDLNCPMTFLPASSFDIIISSLTFHYIEDWEMLLQECHRLLKPNGRLVFSVHHPFADIELAGTTNYFSKACVSEKWGENVTVTFYRRSLTEMTTALRKASFVIHGVIEPTPVTAAKDVDPRVFDKLSRIPWFILFDAKAV